MIATFVFFQLIYPSFLANRVDHHEVYLIKSFSVPPFADNIFPFFLELADKVPFHHQPRHAIVVSLDDVTESFQSLILHQCLILEEEAEPHNQETIIQFVSHFLAVFLGKDGLMFAD